MQSIATPGVPLAHYRQHNGGVTLTCLDCMEHRTFDLEAVIRRLEARGLGGENAGVKAVAGFVREPCPHCGRALRESALLPADTEGRGLVCSPSAGERL
jgi:hypothetical protein